MTTAASSTRPGRTAEHVPQRRGLRISYAAWIVLTWAGCIGIATWFLLSYLPRFRTGSPAFTPTAAETPVGRWFGVVGVALFVVLALYGVRRTAYRSRILPLPWWYRSHLLLGILALTLLGLHSGFAIRSPFLGLLQVAFWASVLSGILGWAYTAAIKRWLLRHEWRPAVWTELASTRGLLVERLQTALNGGSPDSGGKDERKKGEEEDPAVRAAAEQAHRVALENAARRTGEVTGRLTAVRRANLWRFPTWEFWDSEVARALENGGTAGGHGPHNSHLPFEALRHATELNRVEVLRSYHRILRGWTTIHLILAVIALQLVIWHVWVVVSF